MTALARNLTPEQEEALARVEASALRLQMQANPIAFREREKEALPTQATNERMRRAPYGMGRKILTVDGRRREVSRVKTTLDVLAEKGYIEPYMRTAIERFAFDVAYALGARNVEDAEGEWVHVPQAYGPRSISIRQLDSVTVGREVRLLIPEELMPMFRQILREEVGLEVEEDTLTTSEWGRLIGRKHKQATAAGDTLFRDLCLIVHNYYARRLRVRSEAWIER